MEIAGPVLPVTLVVVFLQLTVVKAPAEVFARFGLGVAAVLVGLFLFLTGVNLGLLPVGEYIGSHLPARVRPWLMLVVVFFLGLVFTLAEPDVRVLALSVDQVTEGSIGSNIFLLVVSLGLALALAGGVYRQLVGIRMALVFGLGYGLVLMILPFVSPQYVALAFDSGSTTTGSLSVPLILALGLGVARVAGRASLEDGFGLVGLASLGPVFVLSIIGLFL
ncbi:MAG: DUF1538 domain-containing protein [Actinobacteria bacterium]|nr:DUF1538 domain-containing protein [Actinomycetota bacterium]